MHANDMSVFARVLYCLLYSAICVQQFLHKFAGRVVRVPVRQHRVVFVRLLDEIHLPVGPEFYLELAYGQGPRACPRSGHTLRTVENTLGECGSRVPVRQHRVVFVPCLAVVFWLGRECCEVLEVPMLPRPQPRAERRGRRRLGSTRRCKVSCLVMNVCHLRGNLSN